MTRLLHQIRQRMSRFGAASEAVAAVEFALVVPLLLVLYFGSIETSRALTFDRRLTSAASTLGDLVSRTRSTLTENQLDDYFVAAGYTLIPYDAGPLRQVVSCVYVNASGDEEVIWSRQYNGGTARAAGSNYDLPSEFTDIARDSYVIVAEAIYNYPTLTGMFLTDGLRLYKEQIYVPRFGGEISIEDD